jgi:hypothetical protein
MNMERDLTKIKADSSENLTKMLTGALLDVRRGEMSFEMAKGITLIADKINKNNFNALEYKKITRHTKEIEFFNIDDTK